MKKYTVLFSFLLFLPVYLFAEVRIWEEDIVMPAYRLEAADKNPMFYKHEVYQGAKKKVYPYAFQEHVTNIKEEKSYRFVFIENEYIKLSLLPEIGGRFFSALDKTNNYEIFYHQHVIKPALVGMLGAWISGGIEWCVFHHHRNTTHMPVDYTLVENEDGSKTVWFGEIERRHRMKWIIGITLYPGKSYIEATVKMINRTAVPNSMLYWANVAVHVNDSYQIIFPPSVEYATYHSKNDFAHWPIGAETYRSVDYKGVDLSWWKNHPEPISFFAWDLQEDFMGGYDHGQDAGVCHVGNHHIVSGAKLWEWSPGEHGRMWDEILTDDDGPYAELMVGAYSDNQPDYSWIKPYEVRTFKQYWYPVRETGGFKNANLNALVNMELNDNKAMLAFNTTSSRENVRAILIKENKILFDKQVNMGPENPFKQIIPVPKRTKDTDLTAILLDADGNVLISYTPVEKAYNPELPPVVEPPPNPKDIETIEQCYLTGLRIQQIHNPSYDPEIYFKEVLRRDPNDTRTNTIMGMNMIKRGLYKDAEIHLNKAIKRLSSEYTRPSHTEACYYLGLAQKAQGNLNDAYDNFYRASWDYSYHSAANEQLAEISCTRGDLDIALEQISNAIDTNGKNTRLLNIRTTILRNLNQSDKATQYAKKILKLDPINFWAMNELSILEKGDWNQILRTKMRDDVQNYLELASDYASLGLWQNAVEILTRPIQHNMTFASTYPVVYYYLGFYYKKMKYDDTALSYYKKAETMPADYCFPFRLESIEVLNAAMNSNPKGAMAYYYLGNLLFEIQPENAIQAWEKSRDLNDQFSVTHRNLGWGYYRFGKNVDKAIVSYEKAIKLNDQDPKYFEELDQLYEVANVFPEKRLDLLQNNHDIVAETNQSFLREIMALTITGHYKMAIDYLDNNYFHVREGGGEIHDVFVDAHLLLGLNAYKENDYETALKEFERAVEYPKNLSVGIPRRDPRASQVAYYTGLINKTIGKNDKAKSFFEKSAEQQHTDRWSEAQFYQALSLKELGKLKEAELIFDSLITKGKNQLGSTLQKDFFAKFGEQQTEDARNAEAHYILGLGYLGKGDIQKARAEFEQSVQLNLSHVWAKYQFELLK